MTKQILVTGSFALDTIMADGVKIEKTVGGSVIYFSHAARFFAPISIVAVAGKDFPLDFLTAMENRGIDVSNIEIIQDKKSFHWVGSYEEDYNEALTLDTQLGVFGEFNPILSDNQKKMETLFLANIDPELQLSVINQSNATFIGCDSMNLWINTKRETLLKVLSKSNVVFINETEAKLLTKKKRIFDIGDTLLELGPQVAVVKQGTYGSSLFYKGHYVSFPVFPTRKVKDPTGAGDTFAGGFMGYMASVDNELTLENLKTALAVGTITASINIEDFSLNRLSTITLCDIKERYIKFRKHLNLGDMEC